LEKTAMQETGQLGANGGWVAYRPEIKILDCTIRDGGLINDLARRGVESLVVVGLHANPELAASHCLLRSFSTSAAVTPLGVAHSLTLVPAGPKHRASAMCSAALERLLGNCGIHRDFCHLLCSRE
jgi:hypothetical protein